MIVVAGPRIDPVALPAAEGLEIRLKHHFEQNFHVPHRLARYRAGRRMDYDDSPPEVIAAAIAEEIGSEVDYRPVAVDGAARAAALLAEML